MQKQELKRQVKANSGKVCPLCKAAWSPLCWWKVFIREAMWSDRGVQAVDGTVIRRWLTQASLQSRGLGGRCAGLLWELEEQSHARPLKGSKRRVRCSSWIPWWAPHSAQDAQPMKTVGVGSTSQGSQVTHHTGVVFLWQRRPPRSRRYAEPPSGPLE